MGACTSADKVEPLEHDVGIFFYGAQSNTCKCICAQQTIYTVSVMRQL